MSNLEKQYNQNKKAYETLGIEIPVSLENVKSKLTKYQKAAISKGTGQLVIAPAINKGFSFKDLLEKYQSKYSLWVWDDLWDQYDLSGSASITVLSNVVGNQYKDPYVQHTNKTIEEQRKIKAEFMNPTEALILQTILKEQGQTLAPSTWIRFPQLENKTVGGRSVVGRVNSGGGRFRLGGDVGYASSLEGAVVSVGHRILLDLQASSLSSNLASDTYKTTIRLENLTDYLLDKGHSVNKKLIDDIEDFYA